MNPPFKGAVDKGDVHPTLPSDTTKSELLFLHLILRALDMGGRAAVIVPDGVLFGSSRAHVELRKKLIEENRLDGVVSMPSGVFKPYAGVSTAVLFFTRGAKTERIWFYDMAHDGFSLDDKRVPVDENDIPDVVNCWKKRLNLDFETDRAKRISDLRRELTPLKTERLTLQAEINRLQFESVIQPPAGFDSQALSLEPKPAGGLLENAQACLAELESKIAAPQSEMEQLSRQFWVTKAQVKANKYDLSASRYRQMDNDAAYHESPAVTLERMLRLEEVMKAEIEALERMLPE